MNYTAGKLTDLNNIFSNASSISYYATVQVWLKKLKCLEIIIITNGSTTHAYTTTTGETNFTCSQHIRW